jgi:hypothetical protein
MERKPLIYLLMTIGTVIGGYIPTLWGADMFAVSSVLLGGVGGFVGIWLGYTMGS